jgi:hypothetical protein
MARGFYAKARDAFVGDGKVLYLAAGNALLIYQYQAFVGKDENISEKFKTYLYTFAVDQQITVILFNSSGFATPALPNKLEKTPITVYLYV